MTRILLTAFEPYDQWSENSSWLTLVELTRWFDSGGRVVTRRYPVDLAEVMHRLSEDLQAGYDFAVLLGQAPGSTAIQLETTGLNITGGGHPLTENGPAAYHTDLPLEDWRLRLAAEGIPAVVSHHAGTYLCNAAYFLSQHFVAARGLGTRCCFIHLPLAPRQSTQAAKGAVPLASMDLSLMAGALAILLAELLTGAVPRVEATA
jgi:pyroglutamyl-peptidase